MISMTMSLLDPYQTRTKPESGAGKPKAEVEEPKSQSGPQSNEPESAKEEAR